MQQNPDPVIAPETEGDVPIQTGYLYILSNPLLAGKCVKVGSCLTEEELFSPQLLKCDLPTPFELCAVLQVSNIWAVEKVFLQRLDNKYEVSQTESSTFVTLPPTIMIEELHHLANYLAEGEIVGFGEEHKTPAQPAAAPPATASQPTSARKPHFRFSMIGLGAGDTIIFDPAGIEVKIISDSKVMYRNQSYRLSNFCQQYMPPMQRNDSDSYQGSKYFSYQGKTLQQLREEADASREGSTNE